MTSIFERLDDSVMLTEEEAMVVDQVSTMARDVIAPRAGQLDATREFPWENIEAINKLGLNGMFVPEAYGGTPLSYTAYLKCVREISKACASTGLIWATTFHGIKPLVAFGTKEQQNRLLPRIAEGGIGALAITEPTAGSDATGMRTRFEADGDQIVINGDKTFITSGDVADLMLLFGKWRELGEGRKAISALIVEKGAPGLEVLRKEDKMGHRAASTVGLSFKRMPRAAHEPAPGQPGEGLAILLASLNLSRPSVAAHALGIARAAFEDSVAYINERQQSGRKIVEFQGIQFMLADMAAELATCEAWLWHVGRMIRRRRG